MSIRLVSKIWEHDIQGSHRDVLLILADHADHDTHEAWPTVATIAWKAGISERQTQYCLRALERDGVIELTERESPHRGRKYWINLQALKRKKRGVQFREGCNPDCTPMGATQIAPKPSVQPSFLGPSRAREEKELFPEFEKRQRPKIDQALDIPLPENLATDRFRTAWMEWLRYKFVERKEPWTPTTIRKNLEMLRGWGEDRAVAAIEESTTRGWQGIFEPKTNQKGKRNDRTKTNHGGKHHQSPNNCWQHESVRNQYDVLGNDGKPRPEADQE